MVRGERKFMVVEEIINKFRSLGINVFPKRIDDIELIIDIRIFGKPEPFGIEQILSDMHIPSEQACIFGDRLNTDILAGNRANITTVAVLTGVTTRDMIDSLRSKEKDSNLDTNIIPDLIINKLEEIFKNQKI